MDTTTNFLFFNSRDELLRLDISKIVYFESDGNYTNIILTNKLRGIICLNLAQTEKVLEERLKEKARCFARIGKRFIINLNYVYQINVIKQRLVLSDYSSFAFIIRKSKFPQNPKRSVRFSGKRTKRSVQKRKARNTQKAETKVL